MAVTYDLFTGTKTSNTALTPWNSFNHTQGATADFVVVMTATEASTDIAVTYGGTTMNVGAVAGPGASTFTYVRSFWLPAASMGSSGTKAVVVTPTITATGFVGVWTLIGAAQDTPVRSNTAAAGSGSTSDVALTSVLAGSAIFSGHDDNRGTTPSPVLTGGTQRYSEIIGTPDFHNGGFGDSFPVADGTVTHSWANGASVRHASLMVEILAAAAAVTQAMPPDAILASTNLSGTVGAIDENPTSPAGDWLTATSATSATDIRVSFGTPPGAPRVG